MTETQHDPAYLAWAKETLEVAKNLSQLDYFQILGADTETSQEELKQLYHQLQRNYHPDGFYQEQDQALKQAVFAISKRVTEAYVVLRDSEKRKKYAEDIASERRLEKLRYTEATEQELKQQKQEENGKTPQVRQLWRKAMQALERGDTPAALRDLKTASLFEPDNQKIKELIQSLS